MTMYHDSALRPAAALFHSLSDPVRLAIILRLSQGETRVVDLTRELGMAQSTVSTHVACLRDCGLVEGRVEGRQTFYRLAHAELDQLLESAQSLLETTGFKVSICPVYGFAERTGA